MADVPIMKRGVFKPCSVEGCVGRSRTNNLCNKHAIRMRKRGEVTPEFHGNWKGGSKSWNNGNGYREIKVDGRRILEHRYVMELFLGRELLPTENVHHVNGQRADNRIENLELWTRQQPAGQRVEDMLAWAKDIIATYDSVTLSS